MARANYLAQDGSDIQYAVKELSRTMSDPTVGYWEKLKRLGRYLVGRTRRFNYFRIKKQQVDYTCTQIQTLQDVSKPGNQHREER